MVESIGKATLIVNGKKYDQKVNVYKYEKYRTIFISQSIQDFYNKDVKTLPERAKLEYRGKTYQAKKFGNPNNKIPSYDFIMSK